MKIEILNIENVPSHIDIIYVGRSRRHGGPSALANPYRIGINGTRGEVIEKYRVWLWAVIQFGQHGVIPPGKEFSIKQYRDAWLQLRAFVAMAKAGTLRLACHCHPEPCHLDVVKSAIEWLISN